MQDHLKVALASAIDQHIKSTGMNSAEASKIAGVNPSRMSKIRQSKLAGVSSDALAEMMHRFGFKLNAGYAEGEYQFDFYKY